MPTLENGTRRSKPRPWARHAALVLGACACRTPLPDDEFELTATTQVLPGAGLGLAFAQRVLEHGERRVDFELGLERQELSDAGPDGDDWTRIWAGLASAAREPRAHLQARAGVTWLRSEGTPEVLDEPGDYGGLYLGAGWVWQPAPSFATGPDLTLLFVDAEGDQGGSAGLAELAWRWVWRL